MHLTADTFSKDCVLHVVVRCRREYRKRWAEGGVEVIAVVISQLVTFSGIHCWIRESVTTRKCIYFLHFCEWRHTFIVILE